MEEPLSSLASAGGDNKHFKDFISGECCGMLSPEEEKGGGAATFSFLPPSQDLFPSFPQVLAPSDGFPSPYLRVKGE